MAFSRFNEQERGDGVTINSAAVVCFYSDPMAKETVIVELVNGSKFKLKAFLSEIERWLEVPELPAKVSSSWS